MRSPVRGWATALEPVTAVLTCSGATHRVSWRRGKLVLHDHALDEERVLGALGGERPRCLEVLYAWRRIRHDAGSVRVDQATFDYFRDRGLALGDKFFAALLPDDLRETRERTTWVRLARDGYRRDGRGAKAVRKLALMGLAEALAPLGDRIAFHVEVGDGRASASASLSSNGRGRAVHVGLPPQWLGDVAVPGLITIGDRFVLAAEHTAPDAATVRTVRWHLDGDNLVASVAQAQATCVAGRWHIASGPELA